MLLNPVLSRRLGWMTSLLLTLPVAAVTASSLDAPAAPTDAGSAMYTLQDLCNRLNDGTAGAKRSGPFAEPTAGPAATMCTLNDIMAAMPTVDANGAGVADVLAGQTFWGLTSGAWGLQTGTATAGASFTGTNGSLSMTIPNGLYSGSKTATASDTNLTTGNIKSGVTIFGVSGDNNVVDTSSGDAVAGDLLSSKKAYVNGALVTGTATAGADVTGTNGSLSMTIPDGLYSGSKTATASDTNLTTGNIKSDATIFGVSGDNNVVDTSSGDAVAADIATGKKAWVDGAEVTGTAAAAAPCTCSAGTLNGTRWCDNGNGTVTDLLGATVNSKVQGRCLVWLKNASWGGQKAWRVNTVGGYDDAHTRAGVLAAVASGAGLSDGSVAGDWRLPTKTELQALMTGTEFVRSAAMRAFTGVQSYHWSSTTYAADASGAWSVYLNAGNVYAFDKATTFYVWPVRGGQ